MLVLSRKQGETIQIGDNVVVTITRSGRTRVVLGIEAPASVHVARGELQAQEFVRSDSPSNATPVVQDVDLPII